MRKMRPSAASCSTAIVLLLLLSQADAFRIHSIQRFPSINNAKPTKCRHSGRHHDGRIRPSHRHTCLFAASVPNNNDQSPPLSNKWPCPRNPFLQLLLALAFYVFHLTVLAQHQLVFPIQLIPNAKGHFTAIGYDSLAGIFALLAYMRWKQQQQQQLDNNNKKDESTSTTSRFPWKLPTSSIRHKLTSFLTTILLIQAYFWTGRFSLFWEDKLYEMSALGFGLTAPMHRSLCVLLGHLSWVVCGTLLLRWLPRPPRFFGSNTAVDNHEMTKEANNDVNNNDVNNNKKSGPEKSPTFQWFQSNASKRWLWWAVGGYYVSSWLFNITDLINQYVLPFEVLQEAQESVVTQLVNPEHNDLLASLVGYLAPCVSAPWWEEVLYRGFVLATLTQFLGYPWAVFIQGIVFSAHHMSLTAALPLAVLGWTWALLYTQSRNLFPVILVHALWNSRVFLGSWLGL